MSDRLMRRRHAAEHLSAGRRALFEPAAADLIRIGSRRSFLQTGLAGMAGLTLPDLLRHRAQAAAEPRSTKRAVILFWLSGGPSQLDFWDPKPQAPSEIPGRSGQSARRSRASASANTCRCKPESPIGWP
jgi:hypothetical protein